MVERQWAAGHEARIWEALAPALRGQSIEAASVFSPEFPLGARREVRGKRIQCFDPAPVSRRLKRDRPVATKRDAIFAEGLDDVPNVRCEIVSRPVLVVRLGDEAAYLADDVRV